MGGVLCGGEGGMMGDVEVNVVPDEGCFLVVLKGSLTSRLCVWLNEWREVWIRVSRCEWFDWKLCWYGGRQREECSLLGL